MEINKEMLKGYIENIILSQILHEDQYGYEISKRIRDISEHTFEIKEGTLYVVLKRLEGSRMITSYWNEDEASGGGRRKYYKITEEGKNYLVEGKKQWDFFKNIIDTFYRGVENEAN
ncbi:PadR family transcriptional regulator PadR [Paenibacillus cellulosilyticus]|uniref:PadR family transcriptional regulator PadR n=1 Tax=Paenibacillus cellulosilyticus TaxID=375489 RepID=A0A2V2YUZ8_9BACL|nr:PadR family transcriptional regulator [Paenibacillus cellulosilyticus]PWW05047.1 PadR family transcriptional regulator PadR [Paenibacillus cellulosilyticus]QKS48604.1 PadR family transcriptional regulator [Paenibacillus cellulosilyticus]